MTNRTLAFIIGAVLLLVMPCLVTPLLVLGAVSDTCTPALPDPAVSGRTTAQWDSEQLANVRTIITVGAERQIPARGWVIAVATAILTPTPDYVTFGYVGLPLLALYFVGVFFALIVGRKRQVA